VMALANRVAWLEAGVTRETCEDISDLIIV